MNKIKIGKIVNKITTVIFVLWAIFSMAMPMVGLKNYLIISGIFVVLFSVSVIIGHICLKDYKEEKYTEESTKE